MGYYAVPYDGEGDERWCENCEHCAWFELSSRTAEALGEEGLFMCLRWGQEAQTFDDFRLNGPCDGFEPSREYLRGGRR